MSELAARIAAIIRRKKHDGNNIISFHEIRIDVLAKDVTVNDKPVELTRREFQLLLYLVANQGRVISKNAMVNHLGTEEVGQGESSDIIYTHIKNLRKKLQQVGCNDFIRSVYGIGYKLTDS